MPATDDFSSNREIDASRHRFPFCIVWTPIPLLSWLFPFVGHMGIAGSNGRIRDFVGYHVCEDDMAFGWPTSYWQLTLPKVAGGVQAFDQAVEQASHDYRSRAHNLLCDNCHSHVSLALNLMRYGGKSNWNMISTCLHMLANTQFIGVGGAVRQLGPFAALSLIAVLIAFVISTR